jgi:hypothetical protein
MKKGQKWREEDLLETDLAAPTSIAFYIRSDDPQVQPSILTQNLHLLGPQRRAPNHSRKRQCSLEPGWQPWRR